MIEKEFVRPMKENINSFIVKPAHNILNKTSVKYLWLDFQYILKLIYFKPQS